MKIGLLSITALIIINGCSTLKSYEKDVYEKNSCSSVTNHKSLDFLEQQYRCTAQE